VPILSPEDLEALLKAAKGRTFAARRDTAIISLYTGIPWEFLPRSRFWGRG
jgi:hypothetical protein